MNSDTSRPSDDHQWQWSMDEENDPKIWHLRWSTTEDFTRHRQFTTGDGANFFPYTIRSVDEFGLEVDATQARPLSSISWRGANDRTVARLFQSLGTLFRHIHDCPSPSGFGDPIVEGGYHTFNAFFAAELSELSDRLQFLNRDDICDTAIETLAMLRQELSAFHPHGRSTWTVGRLSSAGIAVCHDLTRVECILDFGAVALRPPEYDLAIVTSHLLADHPVAAPAFWKGYGAAVTCDLLRRISYFERLIDLKSLLATSASADQLASTKTERNP